MFGRRLQEQLSWGSLSALGFQSQTFFFNCLRGFLERKFSQGDQEWMEEKKKKEWMEDSHEGLSPIQTTPYCQNIAMTTQPKIRIIQNMK